MIKVPVRESMRAKVGMAGSEPRKACVRPARTRVLGIDRAEIFPLITLFAFCAALVFSRLH